MIQKKDSLRSSVLAALLCGASAVTLLAQGPGGPPPGGGPGGHHGPPPNLLFDALDTNHDGVLSADEMASASTSLKSLLKNGATTLSRDDLRPARPAPPQEGNQTATDGEQPHPRPKGVRPHHPPMNDQGATDSDQSNRPSDDAAAKTDSQTEGPANHPHHGPPPSPLFDALDADHDGTLSADEMNNASTSLKSLLKNGSTQLKREDLRPAHPPHPQDN